MFVSARHPAQSPLLLDELMGAAQTHNQEEYFDPPLTSPGIPGNNTLSPHAGAARQAAQAAANRLNAGSFKAGGRYRYGVAHHGPKQPGDRGHYHVVDEGGRQMSGHFFYGGQPALRQARDYPTIAGRDRRSMDKGPFATPERSEKPADPSRYHERKNQAAQLNYDKARSEWYEARVGKVEGRRGRNMRKGRELESPFGAPLLNATSSPAASPRLLDQLIEEEMPNNATSVIHPNIDVHAQYALQRLLKSPDPAARTDGAAMLAAVRSGQLRGIYKEDQQVPALRARRIGKGWWQVIPAGEDAVLFWDTQEAPLIDFRDQVRSNAVRLDPALRKAWRAYVRLQQGQLAACPVRPGGLLAETSPNYLPVTNVVPLLCAGPTTPNCTAPSPKIQGTVTIGGVIFNYTMGTDAFNPTERGDIKQLGPTKLHFFCHREGFDLANDCVLTITPAWAYNAAVSTSNGNQDDWEFGFIQNVRHSEILHHYSNGRARKSVVANALDTDGEAVPWFSLKSVKKISAGQLAEVVDTPFTAASLRLPNNPHAKLDQVCFTGSFDLWLAIRNVKTKKITPVAHKRIELGRMWRLRNATDDPQGLGSWVILGGQREVAVAAPMPVPVTTGLPANKLTNFKDITADKCPDPPGFPGLCLVGETCLTRKPPTVVPDELPRSARPRQNQFNWR